MIAFKDLSIKRKLTLLMMLTSCAALLLACLGFMTYELVTMRQTMAQELAASRENGSFSRRGAEWKRCSGQISRSNMISGTVTSIGFAKSPRANVPNESQYHLALRCWA